MLATHEDIHRRNTITWRFVKTKQPTNGNVKRERNGCRGNGERKVIIGGPWRYARGVSLRFLINFYPAREYISAGNSNHPHIRTFMHGFTVSICFLSRSLFIFFAYQSVVVTAPAGSESSRHDATRRTKRTLPFRPISGVALLR